MCVPKCQWKKYAKHVNSPPPPLIDDLYIDFFLFSICPARLPPTTTTTYYHMAVSLNDTGPVSNRVSNCVWIFSGEMNRI